MNHDKAIQEEVKRLNAQGLSHDAIRQYVNMRYGAANTEPSMSQNDGVTMIRNERDAPGFYEDQYTQQADAYSKQLIQSELAARSLERARRTTNELPLDPYYGNPNVLIETEGQRTTVGPNGEIVIY